MNLLHIIYFLLPIIGWSLPNFFIKSLREKFDSVEIIVFLHLIYHIIILPTLIFTYLNNKNRITSFFNKIKNLDKQRMYYGLLVVILGLTSQYGLNSLLKYYDVTYTLPVIRAFSSIIIVLFGACVFKESMTIKKLIGIMSVVIGVYLITSK